MTRPATFTQAQIARAIRAAKGEGMVAVMTPQGIIFAESDKVSLPSPEEGRGNSCDEAFGLGP